MSAPAASDGVLVLAPPNVLAMGRFHRRGGFEVVVHAAAILRWFHRATPNWVLAGPLDDASIRDALAVRSGALRSGSIELLGNPSTATMLDLARGASVIVCCDRDGHGVDRAAEIAHAAAVPLMTMGPQRAGLGRGVALGSDPSPQLLAEAVLAIAFPTEHATA